VSRSNGKRSNDESKPLSVPADKRAPGTGLPRHSRARDQQADPKRGRLWAWHHVHPEPVPIWGTFPRGFLEFCLRELRAKRSEVLHACSGALDASVGGVRLDLRIEARPDVVGDARALPFRDACFAGVLIDPPWSVEYARDLYGTGYPRPAHLLREAARVVRPGGRIGFVHFLVPNPPRGCRLVRVFGITQGCGYRIRALSIFERPQLGLFDERPRP